MNQNPLAEQNKTTDENSALKEAIAQQLQRDIPTAYIFVLLQNLSF
jgi:hypothetical protein